MKIKCEELKKEFKPVTISITFESLEEIVEMAARTNRGQIDELDIPTFMKKDYNEFNQEASNTLWYMLVELYEPYKSNKDGDKWKCTKYTKKF